MTEDEMVGWHHWLNWHEFEQILGDGKGQGSLACCSPWVAKSQTRLSDWTTATALREQLETFAEIIEILKIARVLTIDSQATVNLAHGLCSILIYHQVVLLLFHPLFFYNWSKINHFKMNASVSSHNFTGCTITFLSSSKTFLSPPPKKTLNPLNSNSPSFLLLLSPCKQQLTFCLHGFTNFWLFHINEIMQYMCFFFVWLLSLSIMLSRFIHVVAWMSTGWRIFCCMDCHNLSFEPLMEIWVASTFWLLWILPLQTCIYMYYVQELIFSSDDYIPRDGIAACRLVTKVMSDSLWTMDCSPPAYSVHEISQARILEWVAISFSRGSSWPKDWTWGSCIAGRFFTTEPPGKRNCYLLSL